MRTKKSMQFISAILIILSAVSCTPIDKVLEKDEYPVVSPNEKFILYSHTIYNGTGGDVSTTGLYMLSADDKSEKYQLYQDQISISSDFHPFRNEILCNKGIIYFDDDYNITNTYFPTDFTLIAPKWSSDGKTILYREYNKIYLIDTLFENKRELFHGLDPNWTPDGKIIYYNHDKQGICITDTLKKEEIKLTNNKNDQYPSYSPDGSKIIWNKMEEIWIMNSDGTNQHFLTDGIHPSWYPDSKNIIYSKSNYKKYASYYLWKINIETKNKIQLTQ